MHNSLLHGGAGAVPSGGSVSALENPTVMSSEESSSYPDDSDLELGLGLTLACGGNSKSKLAFTAVAGGGSWDHYARILTAKDFPRPTVTAKTSSSSSSSSSVVNTSGTKRTAADSPSSPPPRSAISQVVGWPPVRPYRMNSLTNHAKSAVTEEFFAAADKCKSKNTDSDKTYHGVATDNNITKEKGFRKTKTTLFVKVNMDGLPIGRKVDLNAHSCYETLALALDHMFTLVGATRLNVESQGVVASTRQPMRLLDDSSDFVLTYEDKDGDWMLVGDVPWEIFLNSVRRLRIMKKNDANGLGCEERNGSRSIVAM